MARLTEGSEFSPEAVKGLGYVRQKQVRGEMLGTHGFQEPHHPLWTLKPGWDTACSQGRPEAVPNSPGCSSTSRAYGGAASSRDCSPSKYSTRMKATNLYVCTPGPLHRECKKKKDHLGAGN